MNKYYISYYRLYPIYEPAEGGYYYEGRELVFSRAFNERKQALRALRGWYKDCAECKDTEEKGWHCNIDHTQFGINEGYIGEGWYVQLERKQGKDVSGYQIYC